MAKPSHRVWARHSVIFGAHSVGKVSVNSKLAFGMEPAVCQRIAKWTMIGRLGAGIRSESVRTGGGW